MIPSRLCFCHVVSEFVFTTVACTRSGAIYSVIFGELVPQKLAIRIEYCNPRAIIRASSSMAVFHRIPYFPFVKDAISLSEFKPKHIIVCHGKLLGNQVNFEK